MLSSAILTHENIYRYTGGMNSDLLTSLWQDGFMLISLLNKTKSVPIRSGLGSAGCLGRGGINQGTLPEFERFL